MGRTQSRQLTEGNKQFFITDIEKTDEDLQLDVGGMFIHLLEKVHWILLASFICATLAGVYVYFLVTPIYEATAKIYIVGSETAISLSDLQIGSNLAADYQEVFKNWHVHELVDKKLGLDYSYTDLANKLTVTNPSNTHILYITIKSPDPEEAKLLADTYANVAREFIAEKMDIREPKAFEEAQIPTIPVYPHKTRIIAIAFIISLFFSSAVVLILFILNDKIRSDEDVQQIGNLPVLGAVPLQHFESDIDKYEHLSSESKNHHHKTAEKE